MGREETITVPTRCQSAVRHQHQIQLLQLMSTLRVKAEAQEENLAPRKSNRVLTLTLVSAMVWPSVLRRATVIRGVCMDGLQRVGNLREIHFPGGKTVCNTKWGPSVCISGSVPRELQRCGCFPLYGGLQEHRPSGASGLLFHCFVLSAQPSILSLTAAHKTLVIHIFLSPSQFSQVIIKKPRCNLGKKNYN